MQVRYEVRQLVSSIRKRWLETVAEAPASRVMEAEFRRLHAEHPDEYFELVRVAHDEHCLLHALQREGEASEIIAPREHETSCPCGDPNCLSLNPEVSAALDSTTNESLTRRQIWEVLQAAKSARNDQGSLRDRVRDQLDQAGLPGECIDMVVQLVNDLKSGPTLVDSTVARHVAEDAHGNRYGIDWVYHDDARGVLSERELG